MEDAYVRSIAEVLDFFGVDPMKGLSDSQVTLHSKIHGKNVLPEETIYVGLATVAGFVWWFVYSDSGPKLPFKELMNFDSCSTRETKYPCSIFDDSHPSTVSMTVLVVEMFNALNNLSENQSLLAIPPWSNLWLVASIVLTMLLHILILYVHPLSILFSVIIIDEVLKFFVRNSKGFRFSLRFRRPDLLPKRELRDKRQGSLVQSNFVPTPSHTVHKFSSLQYIKVEWTFIWFPFAFICLQGWKL